MIRGLLRAAGIAALLLAAGCATVSREPLHQTPGGATIWRVSGLRPRPAASAPVHLTAADLEASLRRIIVRRHGMFSFLKQAPAPLLTPEQARDFAAALLPELPKLSPAQRLRVRFKDANASATSVMDVFPEPPHLVYEFEWLMVNAEALPIPGSEIRNGADIAPQPGQTVSQKFSLVTLKDPAIVPVLDEATALKAKVDMIQAAKAEQAFDAAEAERLAKLAQGSPKATLEAWRVYLEKRRTLAKARAQGLLDDAALAAQLAKLEAEFNP